MYIRDRNIMIYIYELIIIRKVEKENNLYVVYYFRYENRKVNKKKMCNKNNK